jgi:hypothetical protein
MMMSPDCISPPSCSTTLSVIPAGIITQAIRGGLSFWTNASSELDPSAPSATTWATVSGFVSKTTAACPSRITRRVMLAPIRPRPIIPSCMRPTFPE